MKKRKTEIIINGVKYIRAYVISRHLGGKPITKKIWLTENEVKIGILREEIDFKFNDVKK